MSTGQLLGAGGGAALGAFLALPTGGVSVGMGALYGMQAGMMVGGYLDPPKGPTQSGPRLSDTSQQTSTYGAPIPRVYGTIGVMGNIFWLEHNKLKEVVKKKKSGGKGGGSSAEIKTYTYYGTFAVGLCEGPIAGVRRIWVGPDLVYDAGSDDLETIIASNQASSKFSIYLGTADQQPDPRMQAEMGVANCPAFRGLAYVVVKDLKLTNYGNSVAGAQVKVEVANSVAVIGATNIGSTVLSGTPQVYKSSALNCTDDANINVYRSTTDLYVLGQCEKATYIAPSGVEIKYPPAVDASHFAYAQGWSDTDECIFLKSTGELISLQDRIAQPIATSPVAASAGQQAYKIYRRAGKSFIISQNSDVYPSSSVLSDISSGSDLIISVTTAASPDGRIHDIFLGADSYYAITSKPHFVCYDKNWVKKWHVDCAGIITPPSHIVGGGKTRIRERYDGAAVISQNGNAFFLVDQSGALPIGAITTINGYDGYGGDHLIWPLWLSYSAQHNCVTKVSLTNNTFNAVPLSTIVATEAERSALIKPADIDATGLTDSVTGFKVTATGSIRNAIEPLRGAWPFDVVQSGYKIKAVPRGQSSVATIDIGDLGIDEQLRQAREMDTQLPTKIVATYLDKARNYDANEQFWERLSSGAVNTRTMELPIVMGASQALQVVERLGNLYWLERAEFGPFTLPPTFGYLEAGDVVTLHAGYADYELRLTTVNYQSDGSLACSAKLNNPSLYISQAASDETPDATTIALAGASLYALLDIPVVDETLQNEPGLVGVMTGYTNGWPGGVIYRSADNGQTWDDIQAFAAKGTLGYARGVLGVHAGNLIDYGSTLTVDLLSGEFSAITEAQMLNGANTVAYGAHGRWEIMRFAGAILNADGSRTISTLIRGDRGTEWATGLHVAGDLFVLLDDPDGAWISMPTEMIGAPRTYRGVTSGADIDSVASAALTYQGVNLECLSPVHPVGVRDVAANLAISWKRRTRIGGAWRDNVDAGLGEAAEAYEVDIMSGATVKRTLASTTPSATYTAADQTTDFSSTQSSITVRIYQLSSVVGRGYALEATL